MGEGEDTIGGLDLKAWIRWFDIFLRLVIGFVV